jgi:hypothetical protein
LNGFCDLTEIFNFRPNYTGANFSNENGWNFFSNPYLGAINWDNLGWYKKSIEDGIWVLDNCTNLYSSYVNGVGVNGGSPLIAPGQGFWVKGVKNNPRLESDRRVIVDDLVEIKSTNQNQIVRLCLNDDEIALVLNPNATPLNDTLYDATKFFTSNSTIYSELDEMYSINAFDSIGGVPIWVKGEGTLEINLAEYDTTVNLILEDIITGDLIPLTTSTDYYFMNTFIGFTHRFNILFSSITSINEMEYQQEIEVEGVDILGRKVTKEYKGIKIKINH